MKNKLIVSSTLLLFAATASFAHEEKKIGPNGGLVLQFSKDGTTQGEVTAKDGGFQIALLDKDMKPVAADQQELTAITGDRNKPEKLTVEKNDGKFVVPSQKGDDYWLIFRFRQTADAKPVTARLHYQAKPCPECKKPEWLCDCLQTKGAKK